MMDRRTYLAFALVILVLVLHSMIFGPRQRPRPVQRPSRDSTEVVSAAPRIEALEPAVEAPVHPSEEMLRSMGTSETAAGIIEVRTDLVEAEFDPIGGTIRSWRLREYTDAAEEPADLVGAREVGAIWLTVRRGGNEVVRTDSTRFQSFVERGADETRIRFVAHDSVGLSLEKSYRIPQQGYDCELKIRVEGVGQTNEGAAWEIGWINGLPLVERNVKHDHMAMASVAQFGKDYVRTGANVKFGCAGGAGGRKSETHDGSLRWFGVRNKYFLGALILDEPRDRRIESWYDGDAHTVGTMLTEPVAFGGPTEQTYRLYLGPIHYGILERQGFGLERVQDLGPGVLRPFSIVIMKFFQAAHRVVPNYGFEILILSIVIRFIFYPLSKKSMESMKRMQELKPEMDRINEKYKDDPERKQREIMDLYRSKKVNPLGGCLPMLVQLPVLSGLYYVLSNAVQLRKEPFVFWIRDLSAPDTVAHVAGFPLNIMPLVMAGTMIWQQRMTPTDPRQKSVGYMMPIFFTFLFYSMASGLVFYWTVSNLMTVLQQALMNRKRTKLDARSGKARVGPGAGVTGEPSTDPAPRQRGHAKSKRR